MVPWVIGSAVALGFIAAMLVLLRKKYAEKQRLELIAQNRTSEMFAIYSAIPDIIFTMDTNFVYTSCNPNFEKFSGKSLIDIIGKTDYDVFKLYKNMADNFTRANKYVIDTLETSTVQETVVDSKGTERILEIIKAPIFQNNVPSGLMGIARDITVYKKTEEEAMEASKAKSTFLANMSHEIRTPMNAIIGMSELLSHENLNERQGNYVKDISLSAHSLLSIINDILDMSKIEAGKLTLNPIDYDFYALADNIKSMFKFVSQKKGIDFKFECEKTVPNYLFGDDIRLRQILTNICGNAVKFTEKGHVKLKIFKDGDWLVLAISDTGMGIRKEDIPKLFSAFAQADAMKNRGITGTGLGLSICKSFVEMMGGKITIDSEYGQGTVFTITIPIVPGNQENVKLASEKREQKLEAPNAKLLLVDDNEINIKVASGLLGLLKITPKTAFSGREAVEMVQQEQFDIVLMDHMMPEMDGIEATSIIRNLGEKYEELPIIALTANAIQGAKQMFLSNGFSGFLSKPINVQELNETLITWLPPEKVNKIDGAAKPAIPEAEEVEPEVSFLDAIRKIPEINVEIGMERFSNVEDMYHETFELFYKELRGKCDSMFTFLSNQDIHAFAISVHAMKSALATMGIMDLSETASKLETASKNDEMDFCLEHFPNFMDKLLSLHKNLSTILSDTETASEKKPGDKAYLNENIEKALIAANDFDNYAGMEAINNLLSCDFGEEINAPLEDALKSFNELDFDTVVEILNKVNIHIQP